MRRIIMLLMLALTGCSTLQDKVEQEVSEYFTGKIADLLDKYGGYKIEEPSEPVADDPPEPFIPGPDDPSLTPHPLGRQPCNTEYLFTFETGETLRMTDKQCGDWWTIATITYPDGRREDVDVNTLIRKRGVKGKAYTANQHGSVHYWITPDAKQKRVVAYASGWHPYVERGIDGLRRQRGFGRIIRADVSAHWLPR